MFRFQCIRILLCLITLERFFYISGKFHELDDNLKKHDLALDKDLLKYLKTIEYATVYCSENVKKIDINLAFGIFLTNVNIQSVFKKQKILPYIIKTKLRNIIKMNEKNLKNYKKLSKNSTVFNTPQFQKVLNLFNNTSKWIGRLDNLAVTNLKYFNFDELEDIYPPWKYYSKDVQNKEKWIPNPKLSDMCLTSLITNDLVKNGNEELCNVEESCYEMLSDGTNFGYALTHRLLLLLVADLGRDCRLYSKKEDKALKIKFCTMAYAELEYNSINNYIFGDLMMEIMCLCSMDGNAQFLRRSWLQHMLHFQIQQGCFTSFASTTMMTNFVGRRFGFNTGYQNELSDECNIHTTAVASGVFSVAIRYIIQEYY